MIEREFLFWVIVGTSLASYSIGYFLWLFVYWYYDERPRRDQSERIKIPPKELTKEERDYYRNLGKPRDTNLLTAEEQLDLIFGTGYAEHAKQEGAAWKAKQPPADPNFSLAKTSGEPEKKRRYFTIENSRQVTVNGPISAVDGADALKHFMDGYATSKPELGVIYQAVEYIPTSPPPPPPIYNVFGDPT